MLWYGAFMSKNSILFKKNKTNKYSKHLKLTGIFTRQGNKQHPPLITYVIPLNFKLIILYNVYTKKHFIKLYSKLYYFIIPVIHLKNTIKFDYNTNQILIKVFYKNNFTSTYISLLNSLYQILLKPNFIKLKFKGKGYYIYKNYRNTITPQFGYSHRLYLYTFHTCVLFLNKSSLLIFGINRENVKITSLGLRN